MHQINKDDSDSGKTEQSAKINAMKSLNESLQSIGESHPSKRKDQARVSTLQANS
jgi:hypothetical protein